MMKSSHITTAAAVATCVAFGLTGATASPNAQEANQFRNFTAQVKSGRLNPLWPEIALKTQEVMAAVFESAKRAG